MPLSKCVLREDRKQNEKKRKNGRKKYLEIEL
jgi:hypothetical protein